MTYKRRHCSRSRTCHAAAATMESNSHIIATHQPVNLEMVQRQTYVAGRQVRNIRHPWAGFNRRWLSNIRPEAIETSARHSAHCEPMKSYSGRHRRKAALQINNRLSFCWSAAREKVYSPRDHCWVPACILPSHHESPMCQYKRWRAFEHIVCIWTICQWYRKHAWIKTLNLFEIGVYGHAYSDLLFLSNINGGLWSTTPYSVFFTY